MILTLCKFREQANLFDTQDTQTHPKARPIPDGIFADFCLRVYNSLMPSRNIVRLNAPESYYHVYARGASKETIFNDRMDKEYFLYLLSRHLSLKPVTTKKGYVYPHFRGQLELLAYCLMDNHFHLLFYQIEQGTLSSFMKSVMLAYSTYFNRKHQRTGSLFENRFKASLIDKDAYLMHVSRYIHLNPRNWKYFPYSSLKHIRSASEPEWLQTQKVLAQHNSRKAYLDFVYDYEDHKQILDTIKQELANQ
jgi:REP element-mobilizing transposase RayT